jgi:DNA-binding SARP family transcriptional activator
VILEARVLGSVRLSVDGRPIDAAAFERPSGLRLLKLLLVTPGHRLPREAAAELLAPEADPERSRVTLRKAIHFARRALATRGIPESAIGGGVAFVDLDPALVDVDVDRLRIAIDAVLGPRPPHGLPQAGALEVLAELGGADVLADDPYDEAWLSVRERLHRDSVEALLAGVEHARQTGANALALRLADRLLQLEPAEEAAHRHAIELHVTAGRVDAARRQLAVCAAALADAYGIEPSPGLGDLLDAPGDPPYRETEARGIGAALVDALVETVIALGGRRTPAFAAVEARIVSRAASTVGSLQR